MDRIYISCDMEGIGGVCSDRHRELKDYFYEWARKLMTLELNTVTELLLKRGVREIMVNDSHDYMLNLHIDELSPAVQLISGAHKTDSMMEGLTEDFDGAIFIGYHGKGGLHDAVLSHTYADSISKAVLNTRWVGETTLNAAFCGAKNVPLLLVAGDNKVAEEVTELQTGTASVITKTGVSRSTGIMIHPTKIVERYGNAIDKVFQTKIESFRLNPPFQFEVTLREAQMTEIALRVPGTRRLSDQTIGFSHDDYVTAYRAFLAVQSLASNNYLR